MNKKDIPLIKVESNSNEYVNNVTLQSSPNPGRSLQPTPKLGRSFASTKKNPGYVTLDRNTENGLYLLHTFRFTLYKLGTSVQYTVMPLAGGLSGLGGL